MTDSRDGRRGVLVLLPGCSGDDATTAGQTASDTEPATIELAVANGAVDVSPVVPLEIAVDGGELTEVTVTDGAGTPLPGALAEADDEADSAEGGAQVWSPETPLAYATSYTLTATATNTDDEVTTQESTFTTVDPETLSTPGIGPLHGQTVGVGTPIRVYFDDPVADKAAVESNLQVTSTTPTDGVWSWFSDTEVHFRPSEYWPENIEVTLDANLYGVHFGDGVWGRRTGRSRSRSASATSPSPTRAFTPWRSTTATSSCRPSRSVPAAPRTRATTGRTWSPR